MITYAQNLEDVVLNRVFQSKPNGFYIDVGAHDPIELSVTKFFHDLGWSGINIEPIPSSFQKFVEQRQRDINLNIGIGTKHEMSTIYTIENAPEYASMSRSVIENASKLTGKNILDAKIEIRTLKDVCEEYVDCYIDFLTIDVESWEKEVILSADWKKFRPTILTIEATKPCGAVIDDWDNPDNAAAWKDWEPILIEANYEMVYYDGMNRFYLRKESDSLKKFFYIPMTPVQDGFRFYSPEKKINKLDTEYEALKGEHETLNGANEN